MSKVYSGVPRARVGFGEARAEGEDPVRVARRLVDECRTPEAGHPEHERAVVGERALAHEAVRDGQRQQLGELLELGRGVRGDDPAAHVEHGPVGVEEVAHDPFGDLFVDAGLREGRGVAEHLVERARRRPRPRTRPSARRREHGPGSAALGEGERLVEHLGDEVGLVDAARRA